MKFCVVRPDGSVDRWFDDLIDAEHYLYEVNHA